MTKDIDNFLEHWPRIKENFTGKNIFLFLDYDGTLTPIVEHPSQAVLAPETKTILGRLSRNERCRVVIVSGRALGDLKEKVKLKKIIYVGNHGFEISGPDIRFENSCFPKARKIFYQIIEKLEKTMATMPGVMIEDKGISLSIHVRQLADIEKPLFKKTFYKIIQPYLNLKEIYLREGKEVYELRPLAEWDKGKAVLWLLQGCDKQSSVSIYIGDDRTDEDAFIALKDTSTTIHVGNGQTNAQYVLESPAQVKVLLTEILLFLNQRN